MNATHRRCTRLSTTGNPVGRGGIKNIGSALFLIACVGSLPVCCSAAPTNDGTSGSDEAGSGGGGASSSGGPGHTDASGDAAAGGEAATDGPVGVHDSGGASADAGQSGTDASSGGPSGPEAGADGAAGTGQGPVENQSADCQVGALPDAGALSAIAKLPDPFQKLDGTRVSSKADWHCRRQEIRAQGEKYIFGGKPTPDKVTGTVTNTQVSVHVEAQGKSIDFTAQIVLPTTGQPPFPALINVGTTNTLGESRILDQGVAVIYYNNYDLGQEGTAQQSRGKPNTGKYYDIYGGNDPAGLLMAWAWGASRLLDVLQTSGGSVIDLSGIGVTGCSRWGKGAFVIGVYDDRIALTMPQEPSTGGDPAYRIMDVLSGAERTDYNYNGLNWLSDNFAPFVYANNTSNAVKLPIDTNALIAAIAPRGVLVLENPHQTQMGAPAGYMATIAGLEVYKALGVVNNVSYHSDVADTAHCSYKTEYTDLIDKSMAAFLKHSGAPPGQILVGSGGSLNRSDWIDWTTPTLK
jgi:hypothetical protein